MAHGIHRGITEGLPFASGAEIHNLSEQCTRSKRVLLERNHNPIAVILPIQPSDGPRPFGLCKGEFVVPDDFNDPLPEWEELFEARP